MPFIDKAKAAKEAKEAKLLAKREKVRIQRENDKKAQKELHATFVKLDMKGEGHCRRPNCECTYFIRGSSHKWCYGCFHADIYHSRETEEELDIKRQDETVIEEPSSVTATTEEITEAVIEDDNEEIPKGKSQKPLKINRYPCSLSECDCDRYVNNKSKYFTPLEDMISTRVGPEFNPPPPALCRECKHADFYHQPDDENNGNNKKKKKR